MTPQDPSWLQGEVGDELRSMLESTVDDGPTPEQLLALQAGLATLLVASAGAAAGTGVGAGAAGAGSAAAKAVVGGATAKGLGAIALSGVTKAVIAVAVVGSVVGGVALQRRAQVTTPSPGPAQTQPAPSAATALDPSPPPQLVAPEEAAATPDPEPPPPSPRPPPKALAAVPPSPVPSPPAAETPPPPAKAFSADAELSLLQTAMDAVASGHPREALETLDSHADQFATGGLAQEREVLAIDVLVSLGRSEEAKARANRFRAAYPASTHLLHIDSLVGRDP